MKNSFLIFVFMLIGAFAFSQSTCSCGNPVRCTATCSAGEQAACSGYGGVCECACFPRGGGQPIGKLIPISESSSAEVTLCGLLNTYSKFNIINTPSKELEYLSIANDFISKIESSYSSKL